MQDLVCVINQESDYNKVNITTLLPGDIHLLTPTFQSVVIAIATQAIKTHEVNFW